MPRLDSPPTPSSQPITIVSRPQSVRVKHTTSISAPHALHFQIPILPTPTPPSLVKRISMGNTPLASRSSSSASSSMSDLCSVYSFSETSRQLSPRLPSAPAPTPDDRDPDLSFPAMPAPLPPRRPRLNRRDTPRPPTSAEAQRIVALSLPARRLGLDISPESPPNPTSAHRSLLYNA